ncbi:MAG: porphobilinogen synthase, partial [Candidatus Omnitrophota bacterium]|nr:porphobilinogen synthase [Candidatus Omnitrophota bacterium]
MSINIKKDDLIYPYFIQGGVNKKSAIRSFPGVYRFSIDRLLKDIEETRQLGIKKILL